MKKTIFYVIIPLMAIFVFAAAKDTATPVQQDNDQGWPEEVTSLLENTCFDCHSSESGNLKAKKALNFSKWEDYKLTKKIGKLNDISEEVKEKKMPPEKYLGKNPNKALSDKDIGIITNWANAEAEKLMEE